MAEHEELVSEMTILEQMGTQERQKLAKKRRMQQLKKWAQREKEWINKERQLNKRLANILHEENNGLNLKQYTHYGSAQRSNTKKNSNNVSTKNSSNIKQQQVIKTNNSNNTTKDTKTSPSNNGANNGTTTSISNSSNSTNSNGQLRLDDLVIGRKEPESLSPNGRVHFNVGVMLLEAAARNDFDEVKRLLSLGVSPDSINHDGLTALHQCCIDASEPMMLLLLEYGANVDARDTERWTPLHAACTCGHLNLVKILVEHGADLLAVNGDGNMPFDVCEDETTLDYIESQMVARGITQEMIDLARASTEMQLLSDLEELFAAVGNRNSSLKEALDEPINEDGVTRLHVAAANGYVSAIKFLLKHGANVNTCDNDLWRPLHGAACWGNEQHCKVVEMLVEAGADLYAKTANDETVFDLCDNVDLLDKMNQLKDELESRRAASGPDDRLRRTQSRNNSRVHSVRRTSVRDKNQISRREAREEALLRVESSEKVSKRNNSGDLVSEGANDQTNNKPFSTGTELQQQQRKQETNLDTFEAENKEVSRPSNACHNNDVVDSATVEPKPTTTSKSDSGRQSHKQQPMKLESSGQLNGSQSNLNHMANKIEELKLNSTTSDITSLATKKIDENSMTGTKTQSENSGDRLTKSPSKLVGYQEDNSPGPVCARKVSRDNEVANISNHQSKSNDNNNNNNKPKDIDVREIKDIAVAANCDVQARMQQQIQTVTTQVIPMNYTLSNLKKHRSDLRMRATSQSQVNGSHSVATMNHLSKSLDNKSMPTMNGNSSFSTTPASSSNELGPQPSLNPDGDSITIPLNGHTSDHKKSATSRAASPGLTFRKFHGEADDVIDIGRTTRHKCCILM